MKSFSLKLILALVQVFGSPAFAATETIVKADIIEGQITQKNYLKEKGHFEKNAVGWSGYDDGAATPVDGTGGTVSSTCTRTTSTPLSGEGSFLYTPAALGEGCSASFVIDSKDKGRVLQLSFDYTVSSGTYTDDDTTIWIYDVTNAALIQPAPYKIKKTGITEKFAVEFQTSSSSTSYRLLIHQATAGTAVLKFDNFQLGPQAKLYGSAVTDWIAYTPSINLSTNVNTNSGFKRRVGDVMEYTGIVAFSGVNTQGNLVITQPAGETIDTAKYPNYGSNREAIGHATILDSGTAVYKGDVRGLSSTTVGVTAFGAAITYVNRTDLDTSTNVPMTITSGDSIVYSYSVPIVGRSSSQIMSSDADTSVVAASVNTSSSSGASQTVNFSTTSFDTSGAISSPSSKTRFTAYSPGYYRFSAQLVGNSATFAINDTFRGYLLKNGTGTEYAIGRFSAQTASAIVPVFSGSNTIQLNAGDYVELLWSASVSITLNGGALNYLTVEKIQGPSQVMASESVSALYTGAPPTGTLSAAFNTVTFGTKVKDSHNAYSAGVYTVPVSGVYSIVVATAQTSTSSTAGSIGVSAVAKNGSPVYQGRQVYYNTAASQFVYPIMAVHGVPLLAGDTITPQTWTDNSGTKSFSADAALNYFSIVRTGNY